MLLMQLDVTIADATLVECGSLVGLGHSGRQLCHLPKPHHGLV